MLYALKIIRSFIACIYLLFLNILFFVVLHEFFHVLMAKALGGRDIKVLWFHIAFASVSYELPKKMKRVEWLVRGAGGLGTAFVLGILLYPAYILLTPFNWWGFTVIGWLLTATILHALCGFHEIYEELKNNRDV